MAGQKLLASVVAGLFLAVSAGVSLAGGAGYKSGASEKRAMEKEKQERVSGAERPWTLQEPVETGQFSPRWDEPIVVPLVGGQEVRTIELGP